MPTPRLRAIVKGLSIDTEVKKINPAIRRVVKIENTSTYALNLKRTKIKEKSTSPLANYC